MFLKNRTLYKIEYDCECFSNRHLIDHATKVTSPKNRNMIEEELKMKDSNS